MRGFTLVLVVGLLAIPSTAWAERGRPGARELLEAVELIRQNNCGAAIPLLRRAHQVGDLRNALWNLAECYVLLSRPRQAIEVYQQYMEHPRTGPRDRRAAEQAVERLEASLARIEVPGNVEGALVRVDGLEEGTVPVTVEVGPGQHVVEVLSPGFATFRAELEIGAGDTRSVEAELELLPGVLSVESEPSAAEVWLDGERQGTTPWEAEVAGGGHVVELWREGHRREQRRVTLQPGQRSDIEVELLPVAGTLSVATNAPGATLLVDGQERGHSPFSPLSLPPGHYEVAVEAADHSDWQGEVDLFDQRTTEIELELASTSGLHQGWFWAVAGLSIGSFLSGLLSVGLRNHYQDLAQDHAEIVASDRESPLSIAHHREAGNEQLELADRWQWVVLGTFLATLAGAVADFFIGLFTRWRQPETEAEVTVEDAVAAEGGAP